MARQRGVKETISFVQGLNTETSPLKAPGGSTYDELNMVLDMNGRVRVRRKGLQKLADDIVTTTRARPSINGAHYWENEEMLLVVTESRTFSITETRKFINVLFIKESNLELVYNYEFELNPSKVNDSSISTPPSFASIRDGVCITFGGEPLYITMKDAGPDIWSLDLRVRDFKRIDNSMSVSERPSTLENKHKYDLLNAGWYKEQRLQDGTKVEPIEHFFEEVGEYPSDSDFVSLGVRSRRITKDILGTLSVEDELSWDPLTIDTMYFGNTEAPRGHYVYSAVRINRQGALTNPEVDGTAGPLARVLLEDGVDPDTGDPIPPGTVTPTPPRCLPGEICYDEP